MELKIFLTLVNTFLSRHVANPFAAFESHVKHVGCEDGLIFGAGSTIFDPNGKRLDQTLYFNKALLDPELTSTNCTTHDNFPLLRNGRTEPVWREVERLLRSSGGYQDD